MCALSNMGKAYHNLYNKKYREAHKPAPKSKFVLRPKPKEPAIIEPAYEDKPSPTMCSTFGCGRQLTLLESLCGSICFHCSATKQDIPFSYKFKPMKIDLERVVALFRSENAKDPSVIIMNDITFRKLASEIFERQDILNGEIKVINPGKFQGIPIVRSEDIKNDEYKLY